MVAVVPQCSNLVEITRQIDHLPAATLARQLKHTRLGDGLVKFSAGRRSYFRDVPLTKGGSLRLLGFWRHRLGDRSGGLFHLLGYTTICQVVVLSERYYLTQELGPVFEGLFFKFDLG